MNTSREPDKEVISAGFFPFYNIYKYFTAKKTEAETIVDRYLSFTNDDNDFEIGKLIDTIILCQSAEVLEVLLARLKKKDCAELKIPSPENFIGYYNPFNECIWRLDSAKLAVMLSFYSKDVNTKFWLKNENGYEYLQPPPLFLAFLHKSKADIRLLLLYGAVLSPDDSKYLHEDYRDIEFPMRTRIFESEVLLEVAEIFQRNQIAEKQKSSKDYGKAYLQYSKVGNCYYKFALKCKDECNETSKKTLPLFYMRKALDCYISALQCADLFLDVANLSEDLSEGLRGSFSSLIDRVGDIMSPFRSNDFLSREMSHFINLWEKLSIKHDKIRERFPQTQNKFSADEDKEKKCIPFELHQRKIQPSSATIKSVADNDGNNDFDDSNKNTPLYKPRF